MALARFKSELARKLIRWADRGWNASFAAHIRVMNKERPCYYGEFFDGLAKLIDRIAVPLATKLNKYSAGEEMVEYGWWG
jgi:hypothetical protein